MLPVVVFLAIVGGVFVALLLLITVVLGGRRDSFSGGSFRDVERAMQSKGLHICHTEYIAGGQANQAIERRRYDVAFDCESGNIASVVVDEFGNREDRDAELRNFEVLVRPGGKQATYRYKRFVIYVVGPSDTRTQERIDTTLRQLGAR